MYKIIIVPRGRNEAEVFLNSKESKGHYAELNYSESEGITGLFRILNDHSIIYDIEEKVKINEKIITFFMSASGGKKETLVLSYSIPPYSSVNIWDKVVDNIRKASTAEEGYDYWFEKVIY